MKKLIVCCDGTWNTADQEEYELPSPTNVLRLYNALATVDASGNAQQKYYHPGVGTEGSFLSRTAGGLYGHGLAQNVMSPYAWLSRHYDPGDKIFLFGFSRGAFTARSLGGMLARCGILDLRKSADPFPPVGTEGVMPNAEAWKRVECAFQQGYRLKNKEWRDASWPLSAAGPAEIHFVGAWDTVGALGIPNDMALLNLLDDVSKWSFHDTTLGAQTHYARHAIAMDEMRASFAPTLWTDQKGTPLHDQPGADGSAPRIRQVYFPGVHSDVGGGYYECGLSDGGLQWMMDESAAVPDGLVFDPNFTGEDQVRPRSRAPMHNSLRGVFKALRSRPRYLPAFSDRDRYHSSALDRFDRPPIFQSPYHAPARVVQPGQPKTSAVPPNNRAADRILAAPGDFATCNVYAINLWNATGLYLEAGVFYQFEAVGEWIDDDVVCGPEGDHDSKFNAVELAHVVGSFFGKMEEVFRKFTKNKDADFRMTKRVESAPWFSLIGVVANDAGTDGKKIGMTLADGSPPEHQVLPIGRAHGPVKLTLPGHLYAFANDAWHFYDNNRGSVTLRVTRL